MLATWFAGKHYYGISGILRSTVACSKATMSEKSTSDAKMKILVNLSEINLQDPFQIRFMLILLSKKKLWNL